MSAARINVVEELRHLASQAGAAGNERASQELLRGARLLEGKLLELQSVETQRDRCAMAALTGLLGGAYVIEHPLSLESEAAVHDAADLSYRIADAMMARRLKP